MGHRRGPESGASSADQAAGHPLLAPVEAAMAVTELASDAKTASKDTKDVMARQCCPSHFRPSPEGCCVLSYAHCPHCSFLSQLKTTRGEKCSLLFGKKRSGQAVSHLFPQIIIVNNNSSGKQFLLPGVCHLS